ncbi:MAG: hypothetical protein JNK65_07850 [Deltaproteobacteria bacterium]|nr:hypothetical protein [Deltaproteobacteria bacterium]
MKKNKGWLLATLLGLVVAFSTTQLHAAGSEGPELKFDTKEESKTETSKESAKYGDKPLLKFGSENTYVKFGGYGSMRFETGSADDIKETFTFRRFVLTTDAQISSKFRIGTELEFERFRKIELDRQTTAAPGGGIKVKQALEGTSKSEIAMEQAWFEMEFKPWLRFRGGGVLVPLGRFNINHDDNQWSLPRRSLADRGVPVLPTTSAWDELGFGFNGDVELGEKSKLNYQFYVVNGAVLEPEFEQSIQTRSGDTTKFETEAEFKVQTGTFSRDVKNAKTITGRLMYSPALGHEFGLSGYFGRYTPDYLPGKNLTAFAFDTLQTFGNFDIEAQYVFSHFGGVKDVFESFAKQALDKESIIEDDVAPPGVENEIVFKPAGMASTKHGYWVELRYHWRPKFMTEGWLGKHFSDPQLIPVLRWEQAFIRDRVVDAGFSAGVLTKFSTENRRVDRLTTGLAFRLNPLAVFQLAYEFTKTNPGGALADVVNYLPTTSNKNHSVMFGAAFGF